MESETFYEHKIFDSKIITILECWNGILNRIVILCRKIYYKQLNSYVLIHFGIEMIKSMDIDFTVMLETQ